MKSKSVVKRFEKKVYNRDNIIETFKEKLKAVEKIKNKNTL